MLLSRQGITLTIWMCVFTVVITLVIALRFLAVRVKKRALRADDYMILVAYVSAAGCLSLVDPSLTGACRLLRSRRKV
jgi:ABC-type arginine/histidine transport system permease subunit